ncbi:MAG TPA: heavy-metal-associated domain-containing protein [Gemmatimonadaceae bacterium]|nr:heavy-metal-associated domain-containing protein [Gemmatimonadaceae bacterium]
MRTRLTISGMHAVHAVRAVQTALGGLPGVITADVRMGEAVVEHGDEVTPDALRDAVSVAGFDVTALTAEPRRLRLL